MFIRGLHAEDAPDFCLKCFSKESVLLFAVSMARDICGGLEVISSSHHTAHVQMFVPSKFRDVYRHN